MSKLSYRIGFALGTVTREFLRAVHKPHLASVTPPIATLRAQPPAPYLSGRLLEDVCHVPAIVRCKGVDLNHWYKANVHEVQKPARKRRAKTKKPTGRTNQPRLGSLNDLICPVDSSMVC